MIIAKFGGTSVKDAECMNATADVVERNNDIKVVVVSALAGVTQQLVDTREASVAERVAMCEQIVKRHHGILWDLQGRAGVSKAWVNGLNGIIAEMQGQAKKEERCFTDGEEWLSFGERMSSVLVGMCLESRCVDVGWIDARAIILVDGEGQVILDSVQEGCERELREWVDSGKVIVTQGYIGKTELGEVRTLGRGTSDYSGALLAEGLGVREYHLYKDVDGVYEADPRSEGGGGERHERLGYEAMLAKALQGCQVVHPGALKVCERAGIAMHVKSTFQPESGGTRIGVEAVIER